MKKFSTLFLEVQCCTGLVPNKFLILILFLSLSCIKQERDLPTLLKNDYSNLFVNNPAHKLKVLKELERIPLNDKTETQVNQILNKFGDGHVVLYKNGQSLNELKSTSLKFIPGSNYVSECRDCLPAIPPGKYKLHKIANLPSDVFYEKHAFSVAASTPWGREHRLQTKIMNVNIELINFNGERRVTWVPESEQKNLACVDFLRLNPSTVKITIHSLWCDQGGKIRERKEVIQEFERAWFSTIENVKANDHIILDLRENGGGSDAEVKIVINSFFSKSVFADKFQYLSQHQPGFKKYLWGSKWASPVEEYFSVSSQRVLRNRLTTLVSAGCFSSCETLASIFKNEGRSLLIGSTTHGGSGDPRLFQIGNSEYQVNLPVCLVWQKDKRLFEGEGIVPNILLQQNPKEKKDSLLQYALDLSFTQ